MKRIYILIIAILCIEGIHAQEKSTRFLLGADVGIAQAGYVNSDACKHTEYYRLGLNFECRFHPHWGLSIDAGGGQSIHSNMASADIHTWQIMALVAPYYIYNGNHWFFQIAAGPAIRYRGVCYGRLSFDMLRTLYVAIGVQPAVGYVWNEHWQIHAKTCWEVNVYNANKPLFSSNGGTTLSGAWHVSIGTAYTF